MAAAPKAPGPKKAAAARDEAKGEPKTYEWRGVTFDLPAKLPGVLLWDFAELENTSGLAPVIDFVKSLLGEEQAVQVRAKVAEDEIGFEDVVEELWGLINGIFGQYGSAEGESEASPES